MRPSPNDAEPEALLRREARAALPLWKLLFLYLDPFAFFKDASRGTASARAHALSYNRAMRWMLLAYLRRWTAICAASFLAILPAEALAAQASIFLIPTAALAVSACIAATVAFVTLTVYLLLGSRR